VPYYLGDYYQGDYYQGDPFWGAAARFVGMGIGKLFRRKAVPALPAAAGMSTGALMRVGGFAGGTLGQAIEAARGVVVKHPVLSAAGAAGTIGLLNREFGGLAARAPGAVPAGAKGFHMSKPHGRHGPAPHLVRNRHMRVTNPRALRRALRRAHGFAKLAMRTIHLVHPRKKGRFGGFRKKRTRSV